MASEEDKDRQADVVMQIAELAAELGWSIALPDADLAVGGLIMGDKEWLAENARELYGPSYVVFEQDAMGEIQEHPSDDDGNKLH